MYLRMACRVPDLPTYNPYRPKNCFFCLWYYIVWILVFIILTCHRSILARKKCTIFQQELVAKKQSKTPTNLDPICSMYYIWSRQYFSLLFEEKVVMNYLLISNQLHFGTWKFFSLLEHLRYILNPITPDRCYKLNLSPTNFRSEFSGTSIILPRHFINVRSIFFYFFHFSASSSSTIKFFGRTYYNMQIIDHLCKHFFLWSFRRNPHSFSRKRYKKMCNLERFRFHRE